MFTSSRAGPGLSRPSTSHPSCPIPQRPPQLRPPTACQWRGSWQSPRPAKEGRAFHSRGSNVVQESTTCNSPFSPLPPTPLSPSLPLSLSLSLSLCPSVCLSVSVRLSVCLCLSLPLSLPMHLPENKWVSLGTGISRWNPCGDHLSSGPCPAAPPPPWPGPWSSPLRAWPHPPSRRSAASTWPEGAGAETGHEFGTEQFEVT